MARIFHNIGLQKGDVVALVSTNRPEYVAIWVGLSRLGVVTALVNNSLRNMALQHSLKVVNPKAVIASADLCQGDCSFAINTSLRNLWVFFYSAAVSDVKESISADCRIFQLCGADQNCKFEASEFENLNQLLGNENCEPISGLPRPKYDNELIYIYTSGTTGLPKAAVMRTSRCVIIDDMRSYC